MSKKRRAAAGGQTAVSSLHRATRGSLAFRTLRFAVCATKLLFFASFPHWATGREFVFRSYSKRSRKPLETYKLLDKRSFAHLPLLFFVYFTRARSFRNVVTMLLTLFFGSQSFDSSEEEWSGLARSRSSQCPGVEASCCCLLSLASLPCRAAAVDRRMKGTSHRATCAHAT